MLKVKMAPTEASTKTPELEKLPITRNENKLLRRILDELESRGDISKGEHCRLLSKVSIAPFNWGLLAKYAFWLSIALFVLSLSAVLMNQWTSLLLLYFFAAADSAKMALFALLAIIFYRWGYVRRLSKPQHTYSNEALIFLGVVATAYSIYYLGNLLPGGLLENRDGHFSLLILISSLLYGLVGYKLSSSLVWLFALLSLGGWLGAETGYASGWGVYWMSMNYPLRFALFGGLLLCAALALKNLRNCECFKNLYPTTRNIGLLYLFVSLWILSITGNYGSANELVGVKSIDLFQWSVLFALVSCFSIYLGIYLDESAFRSYGLTFLFINLYTRYFEFFWETTPKALFFGLLGISFWYLGSRAEKIWIHISK